MVVLSSPQKKKGRGGEGDGNPSIVTRILPFSLALRLLPTPQDGLKRGRGGQVGEKSKGFVDVSEDVLEH